MPRYKDGQNLRNFLEKIMQTVCLHRRRTIRRRWSQIPEIYHSQHPASHEADQELDKLGNNPMWEKCESLFIKVIMDNNRELMS